MRVAAAAVLLALAAPAAAVPVFTPDPFVSLTTATPLAFDSEGTWTPMRMYFMRASSSTELLSATSNDGETWTVEAGVRLDTNTVPTADVSASSITGFSLLPLNGGGFRAAYSIISSTGAWRIHTATSADGFSWANDTGTAFEFSGGAAFVGSPALEELSTGDWRIYFVRDASGGDDLADRRVYTALSTNEGRNWGAASVAVSTTAYQVGSGKRTDGRVRLFYTQPLASGSSATVVASSLSDDADGDVFTEESGYRVTTSAVTGSLSFPVPVRSTDSFRWRLYYGFSDPVQPSSGSIYSQLTGPPDFNSISPDSVFANTGNASFTVLGEVFSGGPPQVVARKAGQTDIAATAETRTDDQTLSFELNMQNANIGFWDIVITNADGNSFTASARLLVDFAAGFVNLTNNLLRPREGTVMNIEVQTFNSGRVTLRLFTMDGRLVRTLYDEAREQGNFTLTWDGKDAAGATVASGLYILKSDGPKLDSRSKVLVIK